MTIGDRIRRTFSDGRTDERIIKDEKELEYYQSMEKELKIEVVG